MSWSKLKNIIILLLLLTNLCLLALDFGRGFRDSRLQAQAREDAIAFLRDRGVQVREDAVPLSMGLTAQLVQRDVQKEAQLAAALLGDSVTSEARGAGVYRYLNERGMVQFHSGGEFSAQFPAGAFPAEGDTTVEHARQILALLDFQGELVSSASQDNAASFTFRQTWEGAPLFNCQATLNYQDGSLVSITSSRRLIGTPQPDHTAPVITVPTALMRFYTEMTATLGDACREITAITEGYVIAVAVADPVAMTPVWYIATDTGAYYQLNASTGALTRS